MRIEELRIGDSLHECAAIVALLRAQVITPYVLSAMVEEVGSAVAIAQMTEDDRLFAVPQPSHQLIGHVDEEELSRAIADVMVWRRQRFSVHTVLDPSYPRTLRTIFNRPPIITLLGDWRDDEFSRSLAIVGTRAASDAGKRRAAKMASALVSHGFTIFSGLAAGIDTAAHTATIEAGGTTVAVMGTGMNKRYPPQNADLADRIVGTGGALVSQFFPDQHPTTWTFPNRNIVMSGLTMGTVVIEASETSGAKMQARVALQHGRTVFLVRTLVERHAWASKYVHEGVYGTHAIEISSPEEIVERLESREIELRTA